MPRVQYCCNVDFVYNQVFKSTCTNIAAVSNGF